MDEATRRAAGERFRELHEDGIFLLANVADAATAKALADAGVEALATSSAAHASTIGRSDAAGDVSLEEHAVHTELITEATPLPVNVDAENGYGHEPDDVASCIRRLAETGAAGAGIEDWSGDPQRGFYDFEHAVARIEAAVEAAAALDTPFAITGRTECLLYAHEGGLDETARRLQGFAGVGAHCLYAPGTWDLEAISAVVADAGGPVNILALLGAPGLTLEELGEAGVRRVSLGSSLFTAQVAFARDQVAGRIHGSNASGESHRNRRALTLHNDDFRRWSRMPTFHTRIAHTGPSATSPCSVAPRGSQARDRTYIHA